MDDNQFGALNANAQKRRETGNPDVTSQQVTALASLLDGLDEAMTAVPHAQRDARHQNQLAQRRLGIASSLFLALRAKHAPTAAHCLRVALSCSSWAVARKLNESDRDEIEIAALLHDVGKIGVPDSVLLKPGRLVGDELLIMDQHRRNTFDILSACCEADGVLRVIRYSGAWFDGRRHGYDLAGDQLPLGSRMLSIVDAFDSMTTDHVYRRAMPRERALAELFEFAGTQFDPRLVKDFCAFLSNDGYVWESTVARRWLRDIQPEDTNSLLRTESRPLTASGPLSWVAAPEFHERLLESMHDGVLFVDNELRIVLWNRAAERLTGLAENSVVQQQFVPSLLEMQEENGTAISDEDCPVANAIGTGVQSLKRVSIVGRNRRRLAVNVHLVPVLGQFGERKGAAVLLHDASSQITLEERVQLLHERATQDPLTKVANRAEFDRVLAEIVETHLRENAPCSMIICDIDHFKKINDVFGHQAGDEALVSFAGILRGFCRPGDLVARYGGEEFVFVCADCDNTSATRRADELRRTLATTPQSMLDGRCITASFGVTEIQPGDTPETMLRRADRALLQAKDTGRNRVVQLGTGMGGAEQPVKKRSSWWTSWLPNRDDELSLERELSTSVPLKIAAEKLKGFVSDHHAEIAEIKENRVALKIDGPNTPLLRRKNDRPVPFLIELTFSEAREVAEGRAAGATSLRTVIRVVIRPLRKRDRRREDVQHRSLQLLASLKSYFMAYEANQREPLANAAESQEPKHAMASAPDQQQPAGR